MYFVGFRSTVWGRVPPAPLCKKLIIVSWLPSFAALSISASNALFSTTVFHRYLRLSEIFDFPFHFVNVHSNNWRLQCISMILSFNAEGDLDSKSAIDLCMPSSFSASRREGGNSNNGKRHDGSSKTGGTPTLSTAASRRQPASVADGGASYAASSSASLLGRRQQLSAAPTDAIAALPPSYSSAGAMKARADAYKRLQQNISFLSTKKQELQRQLASCLREHRTLTAAVRGAQERQAELKSAKAALHSQLLQMSMITSAMASVGRSTSFRGGSQLPSPLHHNHQRLPFSFFGPQLAHCEQQDDVYLHNRALDAAHLDKDMVVTIQQSLSAKESAAVFEHTARLEQLAEELQRGVQSSVAFHHELVANEQKGQHMISLLDRATDAEVQVLHGAFPDVGSHTQRSSSSSRPGDGAGETSRGGASAHRPNVVFVNASPLYPSMTIDDCPQLLQQMSALCVAVSEVSRGLRRVIENGQVSAALTSQSLSLHLSRGEKIAEAKHDEAELLHRGAVNEEIRLKSKKSDLLKQLHQIQKRQEDIQHSLKLRDALGVSTVTMSGGPKSAGSRGASGNGERHHSTTLSAQDERSRSRSKSPSSSQQLMADAPFRVSASPLTVLSGGGNGGSRRGVSTNALLAAVATTGGDCPSSSSERSNTDAVSMLLAQERSMLELQAAEVVAKIAHLDVTLKRVQLEKQHHQQDAEASTIRSAVCVSLSPARSPSRTPAVLSPTTRTPRRLSS